MRAQDLFEGCLGAEAERLGALAPKPHRPTADDLRDGWIGLAADSGRDPVTRRPPQRFDLFADRTRDPGHCKIDPRPERLAGQACGMNEEADRRSRACMGVAYCFG